jgi:hypothetical protein
VSRLSSGPRRKKAKFSNPTSLWQFFVAFMAIGFGDKLLTTRLD